MSISEGLANILHTIVDTLPWREEAPRNDTHAAIEAEKDVTETSNPEVAE